MTGAEKEASEEELRCVRTPTDATSLSLNLIFILQASQEVLLRPNRLLYLSYNLVKLCFPV